MAEPEITFRLNLKAEDIAAELEKAKSSGQRVGATLEKTAESVGRAAGGALEKLAAIGPVSEEAIGRRGTGAVRAMERASRELTAQVGAMTQALAKATGLSGQELVEASAAVIEKLTKEAEVANETAAAHAKLAKARGTSGASVAATTVAAAAAPIVAAQPIQMAAPTIATAALSQNVRQANPDLESMKAILESVGLAGEKMARGVADAEESKQRLHQNVLEAIPDFNEFGLSMERVGELANKAFIEEFSRMAQSGESLSGSIGGAFRAMNGSIEESEKEIQDLGKVVSDATGKSAIFGETFARVWRETLDPFQAMTAAQEAHKQSTQDLISVEQELAQVTEGFAGYYEARAEALRGMQEQEEKWRQEAQQAIEGKLSSERAATNETVQLRQRAAQAFMEQINPQVAQMQAFQQTLGKTNDYALAFIKGEQASARAMQDLRRTAQSTGETLGFNAKQLDVLDKKIQAGIPIHQALANTQKRVKDAFEKTDSVLKRVGLTFTGLFVVDRLRQSFMGLMGTLIDLAKEGAELQFQKASLAVTVKRLGEDEKQLGPALATITEHFIDQGTAVNALRTVLNTGIGLKNGVLLLKAFEEGSLRAQLATKGLTERVIAGAQALQDRSSRAMGNNTTLQTNYGQALKITNDILDKYIGAETRMATQNTLAGESLKFFAALMRESSVTAGILNVATNTVTGQLALMDKNVKQLRVTLGGLLAPVLGAFLKVINDILPKISTWIAEHGDLIRQVGLFTAVVGGLGMAITGLTIALVSLAAAWYFVNPMGQAILIGNALAVALIGITTAAVGPKEAFIALGTAARFMMEVLVNLPEFFKRVAWEFTQADENMTRGIEHITDVLKTFAQIGFIIATTLVDFLRGARTDIIATTADLVDKVKAKFGELVANDEMRKKQEQNQKAINDSLQRFLEEYKGSIEGAKEGIQKEIRELQSIKISVLGDDKISAAAKTATIDRLNERLRILGATLWNISDAGLSMDQVLAKATDKGVDFAKFLESLLDFNKDFSIGITKNNPLLDPLGDEADKTANRIASAKSRIEQAINSLKDSFAGLTRTIAEESSETFFGDGFLKRVDAFDRKFSEVMRKFRSQMTSKDLRLEGLEDSLDDLREKGLFPQKAFDDARAIVNQFGIMSVKAQEIQDIVRGFFIRKAFDEELSGMKDFATLSMRSRDMVNAAEARGVARVFATRIAALERYAALDISKAEELARLRVDIEKQATVEILAARSSEFRFFAEQVHALGDFIVNEIAGSFDMVQMRQERAAAFSKGMQRDLAIADAEFRAQELINSINQTSKSEKERQLRILFVQQETAKKTRLIQEQSAQESANIWIRTYDSFITHVSASLIQRLYKNVIEGKIMPAIAKLFGGDDGILGEARIEVALGQTLQDQLSSLGDLQETFISEFSEEKVILNDMLTTLVEIHTTLNNAAQDIVSRGLLDTRKPDFIGPPRPAIDPNDPNFVGPVLKPPFMTRDDEQVERQKQATSELNDKLFNLSNTLNKVTLGMGAFSAITNLLGADIPDSLKTMMKVVTGVTIVLDLLRALGVIKQAVDTTQVVTQTAATTSLVGLTVAATSAASALAAVSTASIFGGLIPFAASGGVVSGPMAAVVGEAGPEMITPLDSRTIGAFAKSIALEQRRSGSAQTVSGGGRTINIPVTVTGTADDEELARRLERRIRGVVEDEVGTQIKRRTIGSGGVV